ncbi:hypothetical protein HOB10_01740 [Candidatus Parcubacteria bacterium]|jgi:hypothetical protein|nr:hypothetical protein [Candidatus Parcubacteria bacterium]
MQEFNLNNRVFVKLTQRGEEVLSAHISKQAKIISHVKRLHNLPQDAASAAKITTLYEPNEEGYIEIELWHLMEIFGAYAQTTIDEPSFVGNCIYFTPPK